MKISIEVYSYKVVFSNVGFSWRHGGVRAFSSEPLWRTWWELRLGLVQIGRDRLVPIVAK